MLKRSLITIYTAFLPVVDFFKKVKLFYFPNLWFLFKKQLGHGRNLRIIQKTRFTGLGKVLIGNNCSFGYKLGGFYHGAGIELQVRSKDAIIEIGDQVSTNNNVFICCSSNVTLGNDCLIGQNVVIFDFDAHGINPLERKTMGKVGKVSIGNNVWIGNNVTILKNTVIGENSIVAAGAVISGEFPSNVIIGGIPGKVIKKLEF